MTVLNFRLDKKRSEPKLDIFKKSNGAGDVVNIKDCREKYNACTLKNGGNFATTNKGFAQHVFYFASLYNQKPKYELLAEVGIIFEKIFVDGNLKREQLIDENKIKNIKDSLGNTDLKNLSNISTEILKDGIEKANNQLKEDFFIDTVKSIIYIGNLEYNLNSEKVINHDGQAEKRTREMNDAEFDEVQEILEHKKNDTIV